MPKDRYPQGTWVWVEIPGRPISAGVVSGYGSDGRPLVRRPGTDRSRPVNADHLSIHPQSNKWGGTT